MFQEEAAALLQQHEGTFLWQEGLLQLFRYIEQNRAVCLCALKSVGREHLKRFFEADIHAIIHRAVEEVGAVRAGIKKENMDLMTHFYVVAFAGMIESWLLGEIDRTPEELIAFADTVLRSRFSARGCTGRRKSKNSSAGAPRRSFGAHFLRKKRILCLTNGKVQGTINT